MKHLYLTLIFSLTLLQAFSQNGPGGVGDKNSNSDFLGRWYKSESSFLLDVSDNNVTNNTKIKTWLDDSGYNSNYIQNTTINQPTYSETDNGKVIFSSSDINYFENSENKFDEGSIFYVINLNDNGVATALTDYSGVCSNRLEQWNNQNRVGYTKYGIADYTSSLTSSSYFGQNSIISFHLENINSSSLKIFANDASDNLNIVNGTNSFIPLKTLGVSSSAEQVIGDFYEVIAYNKALNDAERIIVENYLSAKYNGISIANDFYDESGGYKNEVIGIGVAPDGSKHIESTGDILTINHSTASNGTSGYDGFLITGQNGLNVVGNNCGTTPETVTYISEKIWKFEFSGGFSGDLGIIFDLSSSQLSPLIGTGNILDEDLDIKLMYSLDPTNFSSGAALEGTLNLTDKKASFSIPNFNGTQDGVFYIAIGVGRGVQYDGTNLTYIDDNSPATYSETGFEKLIVKSGDLSIPADKTNTLYYGKVEIEVGATMTIQENTKLMWFCDLTNDGIIVLKDGASIVPQSGTDKVINGKLSGSGTYDVKRNSPAYTKDYLYSYWSSPVVSTTMGDVFYNGTDNVTPNDYWSYDAVNQRWNSENESTVMTPGKGFATTGADGVTGISQERTFSGVINHGDVTENITTGSGNIDGDPYNDFNLIGNPFPSAINLLDVWFDNSTLWDGTSYIYNHQNIINGKNSPDDYITENGTGTNPPSPPGDYYVGSMQGFMVIAKAAGSFVFKTDHEVRTTGHNATFYKKAPATGRIWLKLENNTTVTSTLLAFIDEATDLRDDLYDGLLLESSEVMSFYSMIDDVRFSIQATDSDIKSKKIGVGLLAGTAGDYSISILQNELEDDVNVYLEDKELGIVNWNIKDQPYMFNIENDNTRLDSRFVISFTENTLSNNDIIELDNITVNIKENTLTVLGDNKNDNITLVELYSVSGQKLQYWKGTSNNVYHINSIPNGIYIVKIYSEGGNIISKKTRK